MKTNEITIPKLSAKQRAILAHSAGKPFPQAETSAILTFLSLKPPQVKTPQEEAAYFTALCIHALWRDGERGEVPPIEECLRRIKDKRSKHLGKEIMWLLDTAWNDGDSFVCVRLNHLARLIRVSGKYVSPDCEALYYDLLDWDNENRYIQKKWVRTFYANHDAEINA